MDAADLRLLVELASLYRRQLHGDDPRGREFLRTLGIRANATVEAFNLGWSDGRLLERVSEEQVPGLQRLGIVTHNRMEKWERALILPAHDPETGAVVDLYALKSFQNRKANLFDPPRGLLNPAALASEEVVLADWLEAALKMHDAGFQAVVPVRGLADLSNNLDRIAESSVRRIWVASSTHGTELEALLRPLGVEVVRLKLHVDCRRIDARTLKSQMESASTLQGKRAGPDLVEVADDGATYEQHGVRFRIGGMKDGPEGRPARVALTATKGDGAYADRIDLQSATQRRRYAREAAEALGVQAEALAQALLDLIPELERLADDRERRRAVASSMELPGQPLVTRDRREEALERLKAPGLAEGILDDVSRLGLVGERDNALLLYLVAVSRKLERPLSAILRSESASGKSNLVERIVELLPEEDVLYVSRLSGQALFYMPPDSLRHRLLVVEEREGGEESDYAVRVLQSKGSLTTAVPLPPEDEGGAMRTRLITVQGPVAYLETTTKPDIDPQNLNRCFEVKLDESPEQTGAILVERQRRRAITHEWMSRETVVGRNRDMQRLLSPVAVLIPYARCLTFPSGQVRFRRDHERLLGLIDASALLHQHQREWRTTPRGRRMVEATLDDYRIAYSLSMRALSLASDELSPNARAAWEAIRGMGGEPFARRDLMGRLGWPYWIRFRASPGVARDFQPIDRRAISVARFFRAIRWPRKSN